MKKYKKILIIIGIVLLVLLASFGLSSVKTKDYFKEISKKEYKEVIKDDALVYVGDDDNIISALEKVAKENDIKIYNLEKEGSNAIEI